MNEPLDNPRANDETHEVALPPYPGAPRWVKVFGIIALVVVLLFVILLLTRGPGGHGPNRHTSSGDTGGQTPPFSDTEDRTAPGDDLGVLTPPDGGHG